MWLERQLDVWVCVTLLSLIHHIHSCNNSHSLSFLLSHSVLPLLPSNLLCFLLPLSLSHSCNLSLLVAMTAELRITFYMFWLYWYSLINCKSPPSRLSLNTVTMCLHMGLVLCWCLCVHICLEYHHADHDTSSGRDKRVLPLLEREHFLGCSDTNG